MKKGKRKERRQTRKGKTKRKRERRKEEEEGKRRQRNELPSTWTVTPESRDPLPVGCWAEPASQMPPARSSRCILRGPQPPLGSFLLLLCSPQAHSHGINSSHPSFYPHHLAEAKTTLPKNPPLDKTYHPISAAHIHLPCDCLSGLGVL